MTVAEFVARWKSASSVLTERAGYQEHFRDLCSILGQKTPTESDPTGTTYAFEKGVRKVGNTKGNVDGFADVWKRGHFAFEYKRKGKSLTDAYQQLLTYREDLENPPLLVVCDLSRIEVHTNFTGTVKVVYAFGLDDLAANVPTETCPRPPLAVLRALFDAPDSLRPNVTTAGVTEEAAKTFGQLAQSITRRGHDPHQAAHFLIRLLFCLFAEDVALLPEKLFSKLCTNSQNDPARFERGVRQLFAAMAKGGEFGVDLIKHFNGGLFDDDSTIPLIESELAILAKAATLDWSNIEPSIFGTLFERSLDPTKRSQLGAHYTSRDDINRIVEPVVMQPLRREWGQVQEEAARLVAERDTLTGDLDAKGANVTPIERQKVARRRIALNESLDTLLTGFTDRLRTVTVLDPACGSGNFLYVALRSLLDLEKSVILLASQCGLNQFLLRVGPEQMRGLELNDYAVELAPLTVWIGYIQWLRENGFGLPGEPILRRFDMIQQQDAILNADGTEPEWPAAEFIVGNPPFLGDKKMRAELGDDYTERLRLLYAGRVDGGADLVTYWFEKSRALIESGTVKRAGLISTNSIRNGASRKVLERIKTSGDIFMAWSDREWVLAGAAVNVSLVAFDNGVEKDKTLDGASVATINADLSSQKADVTTAKALPENEGLVFLGMMKGGPFDLDASDARKMLAVGGNPNGRPNSDVVRLRLGGQDITGRDRGGYVIDFGEMNEEDASLYDAPFEYVRRVVKPIRDTNNRKSTRERYWRFGEARPALRAALAGKSRCIVTPEVAKHRVFIWMPTTTVPDHKLHVFARDDDYFFGVLHSRVHEVWSLALCSTLEDRPSYSSSRTFGTFPMPWPPGQEPSEADSSTVKAIADAARRLVELRDNWLNPKDGITDAELKKRTLTNLYNARPTWLDSAHKALDRAVLSAYAEVTGETWENTISDDELLSRLLALNQKRFL